MQYKIKLGNQTTEVNERNLQWYKQRGWELVEEITPPQKKSDNFHQLTKVQLQELCKEKLPDNNTVSFFRYIVPCRSVFNSFYKSTGFNYVTLNIY